MSGVNWPTSALAEFYRNRGSENPLAEACGDGKKSIHPPKQSAFAPYRSKVEANYAIWLETMKRCGVFQLWEYEPENWRLGHACFFKPDFKVTLPDGSVEWHETKGRKTRKRKDGSTFASFWAPPKNWQKLKIAAANWPEKNIYVVFPEDRGMTVWLKERVPSGPDIKDARK